MKAILDPSYPIPKFHESDEYILPLSCKQLEMEVEYFTKTLMNPDIRDFCRKLSLSNFRTSIFHYKLRSSPIEILKKSFAIKGSPLNKTFEMKKIKYPGKPVYLRLGFGALNTNSIGHRYVLEIWPQNNPSMIHNHGEADGVVRMLTGEV